MGTYGGKERATVNHKSSKRRNPQNKAWHTKKQAQGKQNITWDQIKYKVTDTMSDHYYRWHNRTDGVHDKEKVLMQQSLYIYTRHKSFNTLQKYFSLFFRETHLLQSSHSKCLYFHGSEIQWILLHTKCCMFVSVYKMPYFALHGVSYMYIYSLVDSDYWVTVNCVNLILGSP